MSTITLIETLYDLFRQQPPEVNRALSLVQQTIAAGVCAEERRQAQGVVDGLWSALEHWFAEHHDVGAAIGACRAFTDHGYDLDRFAQVCEPLFTLIAPAGAGGSDKPATEVIAKLLAAVKILAEEKSEIAKKWHSLPMDAPSVETTMALLESLALSGGGQGKKPVDTRVWENVWLRLEKGLENIDLDRPSAEQTDLLYQRREHPPREGEWEQRAVRVIDAAETIMREASRVGQHLDDNRDKAKKLKTRIDELEVAISASQATYFIDPRTGLSDHSGFSVRLNRLLDRASHLGECFSLGVVRLGNENSSTSPLSGEALDDLLQTVAERIRQRLDDGDFIARLAPDRLGILFPKTDGERCAAMITGLDQSLGEVVFSLNPAAARLRVVCGGFSFQQGMTVQEILVKVAELADELGAVGTAEPLEFEKLSAETTLPKEIELD